MLSLSLLAQPCLWCKGRQETVWHVALAHSTQDHALRKDSGKKKEGNDKQQIRAIRVSEASHVTTSFPILFSSCSLLSLAAFSLKKSRNTQAG